MPRRIYTWKLRNRELALGDRTLIMGVLNVTPDSFSDGGKYLDPDLAFARAMQMEEQGADIIDIGGESTKPGAQPVSAEEELRRIVPVLKRLREKLSIPISVDTYKAETAERALELGAEIINDPSGFTFDPQLVKPVVQFNAGVIFNHMRGRPETWSSLGPLTDVMGAILKDLEASVSRARRAGVDRNRIVVDPGIGFGKRREQNSEIIARLGEMTKLELPVLIGPARKSFLAQSTEHETQFATASAVAASIMAGAHIVRVHDVEEMRVVAAVADDILRCYQRRADEAQEATQTQAPRRSRIAMGGAETAPSFGPHPPVRPPVAPPPPEERPQAAAAPAPVREERPPSPYKSERGPIRPSREDRPRSDRPQGERPRFGKGPPRPGSRPQGDRPRFDRDKPRPQGDRPRFDRPRPSNSENRPSAGERPSRPYGDRPRPGGDRPRFSQDRPRPNGDRPFRPAGDRPRFGVDRPPRPTGDRPPRPEGDRPRFDRPRPAGDRPRTGGQRPGPDRGRRSGPPRTFRPKPRGKG